MNRAALKMASIDAVTNFMFSDIDKDVSVLLNCIQFFQLQSGRVSKFFLIIYKFFEHAYRE